MQESIPRGRWWLTVLSRSSTQSIGNGPSSFSEPVAAAGVAEDPPLLLTVVVPSISSALRLSDAMNKTRASSLSSPPGGCCGPGNDAFGP